MEAVKALLEAGADVQAVSKTNATAAGNIVCKTSICHDEYINIIIRKCILACVDMIVWQRDALCDFSRCMLFHVALNFKYQLRYYTMGCDLLLSLPIAAVLSAKCTGQKIYFTSVKAPDWPHTIGYTGGQCSVTSFVKGLPHR